MCVSVYMYLHMCLCEWVSMCVLPGIFLPATVWVKSKNHNKITRLSWNLPRIFSLSLRLLFFYAGDAKRFAILLLSCPQSPLIPSTRLSAKCSCALLLLPSFFPPTFANFFFFLYNLKLQSVGRLPLCETIVAQWGRVTVKAGKLLKQSVWNVVNVC